ncbi:MAG: hypothetical protein ACP5O2_03505 [Bacteroidales bacterium]
MIKRLKTIQFLVSQRQLKEAGEEVAALEEDKGDLKEKLLHLLQIRDFETLEALLESHIHHLSLPSRGEPLLVGLKTSVSLLSTHLSVALNKKAEIQRQINFFRHKHNSELGMLLGDILRLQMDLFYLRQQKDQRHAEAYRQAKKDYASFEQQRKHISKERPIHEISREERNRLRKLYREASKRCHPDMVSEELREEARQWFMELNNAYLFNDIRKVEEIYRMLSQNIFTQVSDDERSEAALLEARIRRLDAEIRRVEDEIRELISSPVYQTLRQISDFDAYFAGLRKKFQQEYDALKLEYERETGEKAL